MSKNLRSKLLWVSMFVSLSTGATGCSDSETAALISDITMSAASRMISAEVSICEPGFHTVCNGYTDYSGKPHHECRDEVANTCSELDSSAVNEVTWGTTFGISFDGAMKFLTGLKEAQLGNLQAFADLGFTEDDLHLMAGHKQPMATTIDRLARNLDQSAASVRSMIAMILQTAAIQLDAQNLSPSLSSLNPSS